MPSSVQAKRQVSPSGTLKAKAQGTLRARWWKAKSQFLLDQDTASPLLVTLVSSLSVWGCPCQLLPTGFKESNYGLFIDKWPCRSRSSVPLGNQVELAKLKTRNNPHLFFSAPPPPIPSQPWNPRVNPAHSSPLQTSPAYAQGKEPWLWINCSISFG